MSENRWDRLRELFHRALDLPAADRAAFLNAACTDARIRGEVESLLGHADSDFLDSEAVAGARAAIEAAINDKAAGPNDRETEFAQLVSSAEETVIGRYHLLEKIAEGGMGEVWRAEQREPIRRQVAIKLVKADMLVRAGMNTREVVARFESERQMLALMDHPAIARVFDAGSTPDGTPYFVMEYVAGVPITTFCDNHRFTTRERLELFVHVCEGVQHAHQKAVIHRDLKPSNILVVEADGKRAPKIIDFGVAKAQKLSAESMFTRAGMLLGTLEYMSPEQAVSSGEDIDTRTDVYSLGIILYELLAGVRPIELLQTVTLEEFLRRLREEEPEKPSTRIRTQNETISSEVALKRQIVPAALAKQISGDLDAITLKALEKDRSRRYGSPSDLAADIGRFLRNDRVLAVPPSAVYRARKFARRYRAGLGLTAAIFLVLMAAAGISIRQSIRANREAAVAQAINDFLQKDLLAQASADTQASNAKPDPHLEVRTALDRAAVHITDKFERQPEVQAAIRDTMGQAYMDLGLYPEAQTQLERALELDRRAFGANDPKTLKAMSVLGNVAFRRGHYPQAEALDSKALEFQRRLLGTDHPDTLYSMNNLAVVYYSQGKYLQAEVLDRQVLDIRRRLLGPQHALTLSTLNNLAIVYYFQGKYAQAEPLFSEVLNVRQRALGPEHPDTLRTMSNLALDYVALDKHAQAEALDLQTLEIQRRVLGPEHPNTLYSLNNLANVYYYQGKCVQAEPLYRQGAEIMRRVLGPEHHDTLMSMNNLAAVYRDEGKYALAEQLHGKTLEIRRRVLGSEHPDTLLSMNNLAIAYYSQGRYAEAERLFRQTLEIRLRTLGPKHPDTLNTFSDLASMYQRQGKYALAESNAAQALAGRRESLGAEQIDTMACAADVALARQSQGKFAENEALSREALEFYRKKLPDDWQRFRTESLLGASLAGQKRYAEAEPLLLEGYQGMLARKERMAVPDRYHLDRAREWIVQLYVASGQLQKAAEWRKKTRL